MGRWTLYNCKSRMRIFTCYNESRFLDEELAISAPRAQAPALSTIAICQIIHYFICQIIFSVISPIFWEKSTISSYNFKSRRHIMRLGGVYNFETTTAPLFADMIQRKPACKIRSEGLYHSDATIFLKQNSWKPQRRPPENWKVYRHIHIT